MGFKLPNGGDLSEEQIDIINLPVTKDWVIKGAPGTGKTVMAIYRAGQASATAKGKPVLMLVYNNPLMRFLSTAVEESNFKNVRVSTYHQWLRDIYKENGMRYFSRDEIEWDEVKEDLDDIGKKYAHVIIDEAQDFPIQLLKILKQHSDHMTCFIDPNQAIEVGKTNTYNAIKALCVEAPYPLTKNYRNSKQIRDLSALYCKNGEPAPSNMPGRKPVMIKCRQGDFDDQYRKMADIIRRNKEKNIGIIVNNIALNRTYEAMEELLPRDVVVQMHKSGAGSRIDFDEQGVKIVSYGTMKGLEFDIVLLPMFDKIKSKYDDVIDLNRVYVAVSRPINELYMFYWGNRISSDRIDTMTVLNNNKALVDWR